MKWDKEKDVQPTFPHPLRREDVLTVLRAWEEMPAVADRLYLMQGPKRPGEACVHWRAKLLLQRHLSHNEEFSRIVKEHLGTLTTY